MLLKAHCASDDEEMKAMAQEEVDGLRAQLAKLEGELEVLLLPRDPLDERSIMLEVRFIYSLAAS